MLSYTHFTLEERKYLQELLDKGYSFRKIASFLGRAPSSISREVRRNRSTSKSKAENPYRYHHWRANILAACRRQQHRRTAIPKGSAVYAYVTEKLQLFWSPEEITERWSWSIRVKRLLFQRFIGISNEKIFRESTVRRTCEEEARIKIWCTTTVTSFIRIDRSRNGLRRSFGELESEIGKETPFTAASERACSLRL